MAVLETEVTVIGLKLTIHLGVCEQWSQMNILQLWLIIPNSAAS